MSASLTIGIVACGVLEPHLQECLRQYPQHHYLTRYLPAQLHNNPRKLRELLQEQIDDWNKNESLAGIVIGYGVCGRGSIGLYSRQTPLVIPRVQDCIGMFLGSHQRYQAEFKRRPGTRYMTQGWYEKTVKSLATEQYMSPRNFSLYGQGFAELEKKYGTENAGFICQFRESWKRNYQRAAYIHFEGEEARPPGWELTRATAESLNWEFETLAGDPSLLQVMISGQWDDPRVLLVPPFCKTISSPGGDIISFTAGLDTESEQVLAKYQHPGKLPPAPRSGIGLGIDTGGTFTDAVIYDFSKALIIASAKAPTTHRQLTIGIREALLKLPQELLRQVNRVGLSTTLATNAFVERKGRPVALLVMAPFEIRADSFPFNFVHQIKGAMSIEGEEMAPLVLMEIDAMAKAAAAAGCEAVAISGFGGVINPEHELEVARQVFTATGLHAVCGHQLTLNLNFIERATTAAMNAKLIPLIEHLLDAVSVTLEELGLKGVPVFVVKGDGSQMLDRMARQIPVETVLSGPAASVIGALHLFQVEDAVVADMGGTTLDIALIRDGAPRLQDSGTRVAGFETSIRAMAVHTIGLGGDSEIDLSDWPKITIGPRRIIPICRMREQYPATADSLDTLHHEMVTLDKNSLDYLALAPGVVPGESTILKILSEGPARLGEICRRLLRPSPQYLGWQDLEDQGQVHRYGLTLTDLMHVTGEYLAFDAVAARDYLAACARFLETEIQPLTAAIFQEFRRMLCREVLEVALPEDCPWHPPLALQDWLTTHLSGRDSAAGAAHFRVHLDVPLIGVGAPAPALFPSLNMIFNQRILLSPFAGVANAVGAIAGDVLLQESAEIRVTGEGNLLCNWRGGNARPSSLDDALSLGEKNLRRLLQESALANEIPFTAPVYLAIPHEGDTRDGKIFLGVTMIGRLRG